MESILAMKSLFFVFVFSSLIVLVGRTQGTITSIEVIPAMPTIADSVYLVGHFQFTSGGCDKQFFTASLVGNHVVASAQHCTGMLTYICDVSDTLNLGILPFGTYTVDLTLSSGAAPIPCTPGIVPDDNDSTSFNVIAPTAVAENGIQFRFSPNPVKEMLTFSGNELKRLIGEQVVVYDLNGSKVKAEPLDADCTMDVSELSPGLYFVKVGSSQLQKLVKID